MTSEGGQDSKNRKRKRVSFAGDEKEPKHQRSDSSDDKRSGGEKSSTSTTGFTRLPAVPVRRINMLEGEELQTRVALARRKKKDVEQQRALADVGLEDDDEGDSQDITTFGEAAPEDQDERDAITYEAFNLDSELESGIIDIKSGTVNTRKQRDDKGDEDWLKRHEKNMREDEDYREKMLAQQKKWQQENNKDENVMELPKPVLIEILTEVAEMLQWGETVNGAARRLKPKEDFYEKLDTLVSQGVHGICTMTKDEIFDEIDKEKRQLPIWYYKWMWDDRVYGPHSTEEITQWISNGFFQKGKVQLKKADDQEWTDCEAVNFDL